MKKILFTLSALSSLSLNAMEEYTLHTSFEDQRVTTPLESYGSKKSEDFYHRYRDIKNHMDFSSDGNLLFSATNSSLDIINTPHKEILAKISLSNKSKYIDALTSVDSDTIALALGNKIKLYDIERFTHTKDPIMELHGHPESKLVDNLSRLSPTLLMSHTQGYGHTLFHNRNGIINIWDTRTGTCAKLLECKRKIHYAEALSESELYFIHDEKLKIYDLRANKSRTIKKSYEYNHTFNHGHATKDSILYTNSYLNNIKECDIQTGNRIQDFKGNNFNTIKTFLTTTDTNHIIAATDNGAYIWKTDFNLWNQKVLCPHENIVSLAYSVSTKLLAIGIKNKGIQLWEHKKK